MAVAATASALILTACGLPGDGTVRRVDDADVPYRLLEPGIGASAAPGSDEQPGRAPAVYWLDDDLLVPEATGGSCAQRAQVLVQELLAALSAGPSDDARARGRSSAIPSDTPLTVDGVSGGTVSVDIQGGTSISAERLPAALGQVVLTLTSAPGVRSVLFRSDGQDLQVPLPGGVLTSRPVTADDYAELLPRRFRGAERPGCG